MSEPSESPRPKGPNFILMGAGTLFTAMVISGFLVGYVFDELLGTRPIAMLLCGILGMIGGMMKVHELTGLQDGAPAAKNEEHPDDDRSGGDGARP